MRNETDHRDRSKSRYIIKKQVLMTNIWNSTKYKAKIDYNLLKESDKKMVN